MKFILPVKPLSINECFQGRHVKTRACRVYDKTLDLLLLQFKREIVRCEWYEVFYNFHIVNFALTDWDNMVKILQDGLKRNGYFTDDRRIKRAHVEKFRSAVDRVEVEIIPYLGEVK